MIYKDNPPIDDIYTSNHVYQDNPPLDELAHYGIKYRSGRYPYGSGEEPFQHDRDFLGRVEELKKNGWKENAENVKKEFGITLEQYRNEKAWAVEERKLWQLKTAERLRDKEGLGPTEIGRKLEVSESTVRGWFEDSGREAKLMAARNTAELIKNELKTKKMIDVGPGIEQELGISRTQLDYALWQLTDREGYELHSGRFDQVTNPGKKTTQSVICVPGTPHKAIYDLENVKTLNEYKSHDGGETFDKYQYPKSMDSKRLKIRYKDEKGPDGATGDDKDGIVELRRGCKDLDLGEAHYAQVRILVDKTHYIKGMAVYSDNMPDGVDVVFNTNKKSNVSKMDVLKPIKDDPDNPFGSLIKAGGQSYYTDKNGKKQLSLINKRADEGDWSEWKDKLPSQFLSKQSISLARKQLNLAKVDKLAEFDDIKNLDNPVIKKHYLQKFSDECDSAAVHLQAAALPGQKYHVIIPINSLKDNEIYAPNYSNGTKLALVRYPHGGTFEIPILTVNNKNKLAKSIIGNASEDGVGITKKVADRLSGADFDGDTVMAIPTHDKTGKVKITSTPPLKGLEGFDPKLEYGPETYKNRTIKYMKDPKTGRDATQSEMGKISNLITDMTLANAKDDEMARAVRHSMVVIDAGKHKLDYKKSEIDNDIAGLRKKYQAKTDKNGNTRYGGASTLISRSKGETTIDRRQGSPRVNQKGKSWYDPNLPEGAYIHKLSDKLYYPDKKFDKATGKVTLRTTDGKKIEYDINDRKAHDLYNPVQKVDPKTNKVTFTNKDGSISYKVKKQGQQSTNMAETNDAHTLVSKYKYPMELLYADYANSMKALANEARKEMVYTNKRQYSSAAAKKYKDEVQSLKNKLDNALSNAGREREAQRRSNVELQTKFAADPTMKSADKKKAAQQAITKYRNEVGAIKRSNRNIIITDKEWEAIQAGAISETQLKKILNNADPDVLRDKATPRTRTQVSQAKINKIRQMSKSNYSLAEIAEACGVSVSTVSQYLKGAK